MKAIRLCDGWYMVMWLKPTRFCGKTHLMQTFRMVQATGKHDAVMKAVDLEIELEKETGSGNRREGGRGIRIPGSTQHASGSDPADH